MRPVFDARDAELLAQYQEERRNLDKLTSLPRSGDIVLYPDGRKRRVAHSHHDAFQPTMGSGWDSSFCLTSGGHLSFSGSLDRSIANTQAVLCDYLEAAPAWMFHHGSVGAHRGVDCSVVVRVWRLKEGYSD